MAEKQPLECYTLLQPLLLPFLRCIFLNDLFDLELDHLVIQATDNAYSCFFNRYHSFCTLAANTTPDIEHITHHQLLRVVSHLKAQNPSRRVAIVHLQSNIEFQFSADLASTVLDLAASTLLMLSIGKFPGDISYDEPIPWFASSSLRSPPPTVANTHPPDLSVISQQFPPTYSTKDIVKLPQSFTAAHIETIGGIEIRWTNNLADHLLLRDDDTKLMLFHQVSVLELHAQSSTSPLPKALVDETLRTISLLLPPILGSPNPWFLTEAKKNGLDPHAGTCKRLNSSERQIARFTYWRDRLVLLKRTFDDAEPRNIRQLWNDDRKKTQWFTFWVAVLVFVMTVFFGVVQSVAGIVQAWASVKGLKNNG